MLGLLEDAECVTTEDLYETTHAECVTTEDLTAESYLSLLQLRLSMRLLVCMCLFLR